MKSISCFILFSFAIVTLSSSERKSDHVANVPPAFQQEPMAADFIQPLAGSDELGRVLPGHEEVGDIRENRSVALFYFLWQGDKDSKVSELKWDLS
ncbi:MAG: hypothetical protein GXZ19_11250, partial [Bacteroidales bacterium]|nr:hypothetical protein [Bacteroidales bacterium]